MVGPTERNLRAQPRLRFGLDAIRSSQQDCRLPEEGGTLPGTRRKEHAAALLAAGRGGEDAKAGTTSICPIPHQAGPGTRPAPLLLARRLLCLDTAGPTKICKPAAATSAWTRQPRSASSPPRSLRPREPRYGFDSVGVEHLTRRAPSPACP
ncbi:unnamed protein product [Urochloa humidicola]